MVFLSIQATYSAIDLGLFVDNIFVSSEHHAGARSSSQIIPKIESFLASAGYSINDCQALIVDHGPGAFMSLRVALATVNGIGYATGKTLVGVSGLAALAAVTKRSHDTDGKMICSLLNAYNNELYVGLYGGHLEGEEFFISIKELAPRLKALERHVVVNGNGVVLAQAGLDLAGVDYSIATPRAETADARAVGELGCALYKTDPGRYTNKLEAYYLKNSYFSIKNPPI